MYKYRCKSSEISYPFCLLANCFLFFSRAPAVFIIPTLLPKFKDPIPNRDRSLLLGESYILRMKIKKQNRC